MKKIRAQILTQNNATTHFEKRRAAGGQDLSAYENIMETGNNQSMINSYEDRAHSAEVQAIRMQMQNIRNVIDRGRYPSPLVPPTQTYFIGPFHSYQDPNIVRVIFYSREQLDLNTRLK